MGGVSVLIFKVLSGVVGALLLAYIAGELVVIWLIVRFMGF